MTIHIGNTCVRVCDVFVRNITQTNILLLTQGIK